VVGERSGQTGFVDCETHHWWFGYVHYARALADHPMVGKLGPNALDLSLDQFRALLHGRRGAIKTVLLDQDRIAGIGHVYVQTPLWQALRDTLRGSMDAGGAPFELNLYGQKGGWDDPYLFHWEEGSPCPVCETPLAKIRTGSTGSYICLGCQTLEPRNQLG
jgi:formamidopyrimidine-DNA glycosylase